MILLESPFPSTLKLLLSLKSRCSTPTPSVALIFTKQNTTESTCTSTLQNIDWDVLKNSCPPADFPDLLYRVRTTFQACALFKSSPQFKVITSPSLSEPARFRRTLWQTSSSLNTPLSLATLVISTLRHRFSTPGYLSLSSTSPLPQLISRKLLRKSMRTPPVEISISLQKSFVNVEPTHPTPSTLSGRNLLIKARFFLPSSRTRSSPLSTSRAAELTRLNAALSPLRLKDP